MKLAAGILVAVFAGTTAAAQPHPSESSPYFENVIFDDQPTQLSQIRISRPKRATGPDGHPIVHDDLINRDGTVLREGEPVIRNKDGVAVLS